jgi:hypothetical protein
MHMPVKIQCQQQQQQQQHDQLAAILWSLPNRACMHCQGLNPHAHGPAPVTWSVVELEGFAVILAMLGWPHSQHLQQQILTLSGLVAGCDLVMAMAGQLVT